MKPPRFLPVTLAGFTLSWAGSASAYKPGVLRELIDAIEAIAPISVPAADSIEVGSSPKGGAETLMLRVIDSAEADIKTLSYSFTSPCVAAALLRAAKCGVAVSLAANYKNGIIGDRSGEGRAALSALAEAGCDVRVISVYPVHHDKVLIVDRQAAELGSFNCSDIATHMGSENVLVNWNNPALAKAYPARFDHNRRQSGPFRARY